MIHTFYCTYDRVYKYFTNDKKFSPQDVEFSVVDVQVHGGYILHVGNLEGTLKVGDTVKCFIDQVSHSLCKFKPNEGIFIISFCSSVVMFVLVS